MATPAIEHTTDAHAADQNARAPLGQRHDRIPLSSAQMPTDSDGLDAYEEVSLYQKMLSALTGSVLTSLLVTPLDVVRVRLQSQHHQTSAPSRSPVSATRPATLPTSFSNLPPNLGISACCREVFWVSSNAPYCVVSTTSAPLPQPTAAITSSATLSAAECAAEETQRRAFTSTLDGLRKIARNEGLSTLWRGLSPTLLMAVPANVIYFAGYDFLRHSRQSPIRRADLVPDGTIPLFAGSTARVFAAFAVSPLEMFRTRMQAEQSHRPPPGPSAGSTAWNAPAARPANGGHIRETADGVADLVRARGVRALWTGLTLTLWRDVPFSAIYWWGYEVGRNGLVAARERERLQRYHLASADAAGDASDRRRARSGSRARWQAYDRERERENTTATLVDSFVAGAGSGAVAAFVTTPFDVGKTRQQVVRHAPDAAAAGLAGAVARVEDQSMPRFLWHIFRNEGMPGLFRGWAARLMKIAPSTAIMVSTYELGKKWASKMNEQRNLSAREDDA